MCRWARGGSRGARCRASCRMGASSVPAAITPSRMTPPWACSPPGCSTFGSVPSKPPLTQPRRSFASSSVPRLMRVTGGFPGMGTEMLGSWVAVKVQRPRPCRDVSLLSRLCLILRGRQRPVPTGIRPGPSAAVLPWYGPSRGGCEDGEGHLLRGATSCPLSAPQILMNALMAPTPAATTSSARMPWGHIAAPALLATTRWVLAGRAWVRAGGSGDTTSGTGRRTTVISVPCSSLSFPVQLQLPGSFLHQM